MDVLNVCQQHTHDEFNNQSDRDLDQIIRHWDVPLPQSPTSIELAGHHFGSSIVRTATACPQELPVLHEITESKVSNLDMVLGVQ